MKRICFCAILMLLSPAARLCANDGTVAAPDLVAVEYLANKAYAPEKGYVVVRSAFEVDGPPHRWIALDVEFRLSQAVPLVRADGKAFMKRWNDLFLPVTSQPTRWTDCRLDVDFRELEQAKNLPKDKTFVVWAMGLIFDHSAGKHIGSGWSVRVPLLLTTDASGRIQTALTPTFAPISFAYPSDKTIDARRVDIRTNDLTPLTGVQAYQVVHRDATPVTVLAGPKGQLWKPVDFGGAFGPIDSAPKAEELVRLMHPGGVILRTREQYDIVIDAARKLGWLAEDLPKDDPEFPGLRVTPVEGLGWRVEALLIEPRKDGLGDMAAWDYCICTDGRVGAKRGMLLRGPGGKAKTPVHADVYTAVVQSHLAGLSPDVIQPRIIPTDDVAKFPLPAEFSTEIFELQADGDDAPAKQIATSPPTSQPAEPPATHQADPADPIDTITTSGPTPIRKSQ